MAFVQRIDQTQYQSSTERWGALLNLIQGHIVDAQLKGEGAVGDVAVNLRKDEAQTSIVSLLKRQSQPLVQDHPDGQIFDVLVLEGLGLLLALACLLGPGHLDCFILFHFYLDDVMKNTLGENYVRSVMLGERYPE